MRVTFLTIRGLCKNAQRVLRHIRKNERSGKVSEEIFDMSGLNEPVIRSIPLIEGRSVRRSKKSDKIPMNNFWIYFFTNTFDKCCIMCLSCLT